MFPGLNSRRALSIVGIALLAATGCGDRVERRVAQILEWERDPTAGHLERIRDSLADVDAPVRAGALAALVRLGTSDAKERSRASLTDPDALVRAAAVKCLLDLKDEEAVADLARVAVEDPDWRARRGAVEALGVLGTSRHAGDAIRALGDSTAQVRLAAVEAVVKLGPAPAVEALAKLAAGETSWEVRAAAAEALGHTGASDAYVALRTAALDPNEFVRAAAAAAMRALARQGVPEPAETVPPPAKAPQGPQRPGRQNAPGPPGPGGGTPD
jgi:HEAT repeat protein